jgi:phospholipid/cholesterol/gamma-HCH transport system substrate-binding protein
LAATLAAHKDSLSRAIDSLPAALRVLNDNRKNIVDTFAALQIFATVAAHILSKTKADFVADFKDLYSVIKPINDNRADFVSDLDLLPTFPFTTRYLRRAVRGDYLNVFVTFDLTIRRLGETIFTTSFMDPNMKHLNEVVNPPDWLIGSFANLNGQAADPFKIPPGTASGQEVPPK